MAKVRVNWGSTDDGLIVRLFAVHNTAHNCLYVLAPDLEAAMSVAYTANHIYSPQVKYADTYSRSVYEVRSPEAYGLNKHWIWIEDAIAQRLVGTVHFEDGHICIGEQVVGGKQMSISASMIFQPFVIPA